ncbi:MAG: tRNA-intron lyase [Methanophagales archaeon ANME-1-THS]|nr:MAG: tRNA-intron lyase [Methanophagales archaeon ANME-1-THS]
MLSLVEAAYVTKKGGLALDLERFLEYATAVEDDFMAKYAVYEDLREKGLILKTGFKFGSHFRVYQAIKKKHSTDLIQVLPGAHVFSMPELARAVRLAHGVKKRMIFVYQTPEKAVKKPAPPASHPPSGKHAPRLSYVDIGRMKL